jgi:hypothetical protein
LQRDARPRYVQAASATARLLFVRRRSCLTRNCFYFSVWRHDTLSQQQGDFQFPMANYTTSVVGNVSIEWIARVVGESKARKRQHFLRHLYIKCIILPRQARDKHRESTQKKCRFPSGDPLLCVCRTEGRPRALQPGSVVPRSLVRKTPLPFCLRTILITPKTDRFAKTGSGQA